mmetsp:Transcript_530/g.799  ORF Transcript_530/g.799 Transcript_530/m.799 type:complete len:685 (-) Transcript_530:136-2190(-)
MKREPEEEGNQDGIEREADEPRSKKGRFDEDSDSENEGDSIEGKEATNKESLIEEGGTKEDPDESSTEKELKGEEKQNKEGDKLPQEIDDNEITKGHVSVKSKDEQDDSQGKEEVNDAGKKSEHEVDDYQIKEKEKDIKSEDEQDDRQIEEIDNDVVEDDQTGKKEEQENAGIDEGATTDGKGGDTPPMSEQTVDEGKAQETKEENSEEYPRENLTGGRINEDGYNVAAESTDSKQEQTEELIPTENSTEEIEKDAEISDGDREITEGEKKGEATSLETEDDTKMQKSIETPLIASTVFDQSSSNVSTQNSTGRRLTFPEKLYELLNVKDCQDAICWLPNGNAFALHPTMFIKKILPKHFEGTKFESFTRKLNRWGFKRIAGDDAPEDTFAYSHHLFKRDYPELCRGMSGGKKMEQDFSHLLRYREREKLLNAAATNTGGMIGAQRFGFGGIPGAQPGIGGMVGMNGMAVMGQMGAIGQMGTAGIQPGFDQQAQIQNLLFQRQLTAAGGMGGAQYGSFGCPGGFEREIALREMLLRQEAAAGNQAAIMQQQRLSANNNFSQPGVQVAPMGAPGMQQFGSANTAAPTLNMHHGNIQQLTMMGANDMQEMANMGLTGPPQDMQGSNMGAPAPIGRQQSGKGDDTEPMKLQQQLNLQQQFSVQESGNNANFNGLQRGDNSGNGQFGL